MSHNLQQAAERLLRELGYEICADDDVDGWYWRLGEFDSRGVRLADDSIDQATEDALRDLVARTKELIAAAGQVVDHWDQGDLAEAVRELDACLRAMEPERRLDEISDSNADDTLVLGGDGARIDRPSWLVHGDAADGPWLDKAYLQQEAAIARAREIGQEWLDEGRTVDPAQLDAALRAGISYCPCDGLSVALSPIDVIGDPAR